MQGAKRFEFCLPVTVIVDYQLHGCVQAGRYYLWFGPLPILAGTPVRPTVYVLLFSLYPGKCQTVTLNYATISSFHVILNVSFSVIHLVDRRFVRY